MRWISVLVLLVACRHEATLSPDASATAADGSRDASALDSAAPDARDIDAAPDPVLACESTGPMGTLAVLGPPGLTVVFHDADGAVLSQSQFDAQGSASGTIPPCGAVTIAGSGGKLFSVTHVMPGETIDFTIPYAPGPTRQLSVAFPAVSGAQFYSVRPASNGWGCQGFGSSTSPITLDINNNCIATDNSVSILVIASDANNQMLAYADLASIPVASSGTTSASVTQWRTDTRTATGNIVNLPDPTWQPSVRFGALLADRFASGLVLPTSTLPAVGTTVFVDARVEHPHGHESGIDWLMKVVPATATISVTLDGAQDFAPHVSTITRDNSDRARPLISWTTTATPAANHAIAIIADWTQSQWYLIAAPNQPGALRFPDLPAALRPTSAPQTGWQAQAVMVASLSTFPSFAELRRHPFALWYPTLYADPTATFVFQSSASGDYDQP